MRKRIDRLEYIAIILMLLSSGTVCFYRIHVMLTLVVLLLYSCYFYFRHPRKSNQSSLVFVSIYVFYITINFLINNSISNINSTIPYIVFAICSYMILSKMTPQSIATKLFRVVGVLSIISIIIYVLYSAGIVGHHVRHSSSSDFLICALHCMGWITPFNRLAGLWWEPGAYQIILNISLFYFIALNTNYKQLLLKKNLKFLIPIVIAIILTQSTTGYITFFILLSWSVFRYQKIKTKHNKLFLLSLTCIVISFGYLAYNSDVVQDKIAQSDSEARSSYTIRKADNLGLLQMIVEKPISGWGVGSKDFRDRANELDNETSSNGVLFFIAIFGIPFFIFLIFRCWRQAKNWEIQPLIYVLFLILFCIGECFLYYPLIFTFLIDFAKPSNKRINIFKRYESSSNYAYQTQQRALSRQKHTYLGR